MEKFTIKLFDFIKKNKFECFILLLILITAAFLRLYKIDQYMTFLGDEGRDVIVVRRFLTELHPPLIGPGTSVGNMYLGPLYYYMMAPALLLANFSPVGPAVQIAILGVATIFFIWFLARKWFGKTAGLVAAGLYAINPTVINFSRSSWNPNIMPFFALLSIYAIWKVYQEKKYSWLIVLGISYAFVLQSHYLGLLLLPVIVIFWFLSRPPIRYTLYAISLFAILMSPLLFFDIRHGWINLSAITKFFTSSHDIGFSFSNYLNRIVTVINMLFVNIFAIKNIYFGIIAIVGSLILFSRQHKLLFLWLIFGILGMAYYKGPIYDHYLEFLFPVPFLLVGALAEKIINSKNLILKILLGISTLCLVVLSFKNDPPIVHPVMQLPRSIAVAKVIQEKAHGERFNLATISDLNNRDVYEYFLLVWGEKIVDTDPSSVKFTVTDQLFVVCELPREKCDPIHNPSAWITNFGWTKIEDEWEVWGGTLFKLGHTK
ncbi:MAG TPA: glycosyltransferase family 39 protein [Alphaproteobacteria bacterium]|jgi:4-amino-4-deoxy-L-arabinose transferase-like glycosyltransferase|nr:glycosyltransferase family 39 protein [Alphaproteobacteria bacterium]